MTKLLTNPWMTAPLGAVVYLASTLFFWRTPPLPPPPKAAEAPVLRGLPWEFSNPEADQLIAETLKIAERIAGLSPVAVAMAKDSVNRAFETTLAEGVRYERALFLSLFGTPDQREGMAAFVEKRKPVFKSR